MWCFLKMMLFILTFRINTGAFGRNIFMNPESKMNISQIISHWGYPNEKYDVVTEDGYILGLYRIPYGKANSDKSDQRLVVYLQHGLFTTASCWISNLPNNSLGFILADTGYDVWMGNSRGTTWSRKHVRLDTNSEEFWAFSFDEMAKYDLPALINFIVNHTKQEEIFYVGHSQGTTIALITFSTMPKIAERIKVFFALAPVFSIKHIQIPVVKIAYKLKTLILAISGKKEFLPNNSFKQFLSSTLCPLKIFHRICHNILLIMAGSHSNNINMSRLDMYMVQNIGGTSVQNMIHWSQLLNSTQLKAFDWGSPAQNILHYNQKTPPIYNVSEMSVPTATWSGGKDLLADSEDVKNSLSEIKYHIYHKTISYYNHLDFLFGLDVFKQIYLEIINIIENNI
ncbi:lipase member J-like isoform X1 [Suncus etruscus]|uniref:lipase member J-like isoform X1 n=1 Tax=Suncus etruscus TaxID=109475 RepID=UPI00210F9DCA|nr:lipase member J-like isoform X1 [Suncus etruscus]